MTTQEPNATLAEAAIMYFEPLTPEELEICTPPTNDEWSKEFIGHLVALRFAKRFMAMSKDETIAALRKIQPDVLEKFFDDLDVAQSFFAGWAGFLDNAKSRLLVAGSALVVETDREARS